MKMLNYQKLYVEQPCQKEYYLAYFRVAFHSFGLRYMASSKKLDPELDLDHRKNRSMNKANTFAAAISRPQNRICEVKLPQ